MDNFIKQVMRENKADITRKPSADDKNQLFYYFYHGDERFGHSDGFAAQWQRLPDFDFNGKELANILQKTKAHLRLPALQTRKMFFRHDMADHWHCWERPAMAVMQTGDTNAQDLSVSLISAADLLIRPGDRFMDIWFERALACAPRFDAQAWSNSALACAKLGIVPPNDWAVSLRNNIQSVIDSPYSQNGDNTAYAMAALHAISDEKIYRDIYQLLKPAMVTLSNNKSQLGQRHRGALWFDGQSTDLTFLLDDCTSPAEEAFVRRLLHLGYTIKAHENPIAALPGAIDFCLYHKGHRLLMEMDGYPHFLHDTQSGQLTIEGLTLFSTALCHKMAPESIIVRIPYTFDDYWMEHKNNPLYQRAMMSFIADEAISMGPGAYIVSMANDELEIVPMPIAAMDNHSYHQTPVAAAPSFQPS